MAIRIERNEAGNCINFHGSSNPTYWNACLSGHVDVENPDQISVINDIITSQTGVIEYEFYRVPYTEFTDADGNTFNTAQEVADYITEKANVIGLSGEGIDLTGENVCFSLDATSTSIMLDTGHAYGVNTIKAVAAADGTIHIVSNDGADDITYFHHLDAVNTCVNGNPVSGGLQDVVNTLNELFTVGAFESIVIADPYSTMVADVSGTTTSVTYVGNGIDPVGNDVYGSTSSNSQNGFKTVETIDQAGEYFTFDIRVEGTIGFGLVHSQDSYDDGYWSGYQPYADPTRFGVDNSAHYGFQFSHWFHPTPNGSWTNYGSNTSYSMRAGWSNFNGTDEQVDWLAGNPIKVRVGIDSNSYISIETLRNGTDWVVHTRTSYPIVQGSEFHLGIKTNHTGARVHTLPKVHLLEPAAPTMYFRYIESPDGVFHYPLFSTEEEANYYDLQNGGTGTSSVNVYPDEPTFTQWYEPTNGHTHNGTAAPTNAILFEGNPINWTEITSQTNADLAPDAFSDTTVTVNELSAVNIQLHPVDAPYTTTIVDNDNSGLSMDANGIHLQGSAPEVTSDYNTNPTDTYTIDVVRTNSYGSATGTLTLVVTNLTAPVNPISGFNHESASTAMIDANTMDDGSVVHVNNTVADGERFVIEKAYVQDNILPSLNATNDKYIIGLANDPHDFSTLELSDFDTAIVWEYETASSHTFKFYRDGSVVQNIVINSMTQAFYDYAIEINGTSAWLIACNLNNIMNEASPADGGSFSNTYEATNIEETAPVKIHMAALNTTGDISVDDIETITTPTPTPTILTPWTKALDFSGSNEHARQVSNSPSTNPLSMGSNAVTVNAHNSYPNKTSNSAYSRPWATVVVFKADGNNSNQHIWNYGEGASSGNDNIYLKLDAQNQLQFNWGRVNAGSLNQMRVASGIQTNTWYAVYIAHKGARYSSSDATSSNLADAFDVRLMSSGDSFTALGNNLSTSSNWTSTGGRMDRSITGIFTIGGRGSNRSFHGKVASMIVTTLVNDRDMPTDAEIKTMITDPVKWLNDYKIGVEYRFPNSQYAQYLFTANGTNENSATQIWLMGDGTYDSYANGIRGQVQPTNQNYTKLQLNSMVSNDIENVNIQGLS